MLLSSCVLFGKLIIWLIIWSDDNIIDIIQIQFCCFVWDSFFYLFMNWSTSNRFWCARLTNYFQCFFSSPLETSSFLVIRRSWAIILKSDTIIKTTYVCTFDNSLFELCCQCTSSNWNWKLLFQMLLLVCLIFISADYGVFTCANYPGSINHMQQDAKVSFEVFDSNISLAHIHHLHYQSHRWFGI